ncbi:MAG: AI-2E family transporter [Proteobacteria bacterium]|nr:AI-2E family transporter [Pseudomonadota bacterium]
MSITEDRNSRSKWFYRGLVALSLVVFVSIVLALRTMIVPSIVGGFLAYACLPILRKLKQKGIPDALAILILLGGFVGGIALVTEQIKETIPDEDGKLVLRIRVQYKMNEKYNEFLGGEKNFITETMSEEIDPFFNDINSIISLSPKEQLSFEQYFQDYKEEMPELERYYDYYIKNLAREIKLKALGESEQSKKAAEEKALVKTPDSEQASFLSKISDVISIWLVAPFVFLFLLVDNGEIKKSLIQLVPNRYFEMVLTIVDNVDEAIGNYLRGTLIQCSLVGLTFFVCLFLVGIDFQWALIIGIVAGAANYIPLLGPPFGLVVGVLYALIAEDMQPILPFIDPNNIILWVLITVGIVQALDNTVFAPVVVGSAVSLHPLVIIFAVLGGSIMFGFAGMLFAVPAVVIVKVTLSTLIHEMKAYSLIE